MESSIPEEIVYADDCDRNRTDKGRGLWESQKKRKDNGEMW